MRVSKYFVPTRKEIPREAEIPSHQMMLRAGLIRQHSAGVYSILPMGWRILRNIMDVIREEMDAIGCQEFFLPALSTGELWTRSGRWDTFGDDMFKFTDRKGREMCLAPTHEEVFAEIAANDIQSYRDLPQMWYQIQTKFRDEIRPRSGILRIRQFLMKDAYSFDYTQEGLDESYRLQREAYLNIFRRVGLDVIVVKASSGAMGGRDCEEFMVLAEAGDDEIVNCPSCGYAANQEIAESQVDKVPGKKTELRKVHTPGMRTIQEVAGFLEVYPSRLVKSLMYKAGDSYVFALVRGDHQVDEAKLEAVIGECRPAEPEEVMELTGAEIGFISPIGIRGVMVLADPAFEGMTDLVAGANEQDYHVLGVDMERDINVDNYVPLRTVQAGEPCIECSGPLKVSRTIEVGHIFKLGTRYSEALGAYFLDGNGTANPIIMGSYGIGVERIMASVIETNFDGNKMVWPRKIAPFLVEVLPLNIKNAQSINIAEDLYNTLSGRGISVLMDDRDDRAGVKFKDADLFGSPVVIVIGERNLKDGFVELRVQDKDATEKIKVESITPRVMRVLNLT